MKLLDKCIKYAFGLNLNNNVNYGYVRRGELCDFKSLGKGKNLSLISAIDDQEIQGSMFFDGSLKSQDFKYCLYELKKNYKNIIHFLWTRKPL